VTTDNGRKFWDNLCATIENANVPHEDVEMVAQVAQALLYGEKRTSTATKEALNLYFDGFLPSRVGLG
jgi:hypothetical protein